MGKITGLDFERAGLLGEIADILESCDHSQFADYVQMLLGEERAEGFRQKAAALGQPLSHPENEKFLTWVCDVYGQKVAAQCRMLIGTSLQFSALDVLNEALRRVHHGDLGAAHALADGKRV